MLTRRTVLQGFGLATVPLLGGARLRSTAASEPRSVGVNLLGSVLGTHVPAISGLVDDLPAVPGYGPPRINRLDQVRTLTQTLVAGAAEIGETDPISVFRAVEAGADLRIIGTVYLNTSQVFVANADRVQDFQDLERPGVTVAVNGRGVVSHVVLVGPLLRRGVDLKKVTLVEMGSSGARTRALLAKRVDAVPMHFDQAAKVMKQGNFKLLLEPWKEYAAWIHEVWAVPGSWLQSPANQRVAVDLMKAVIMAFRRANADYGWYADRYRRHVTQPRAAETTDAELRPLWQKLAQEVKAWPADGGLRVAAFQELMPTYRAADAVAGSVRVEQVVDPTYVERALRELGG